MQEMRSVAKCAGCGSTDQLLRCSNCKTIFYCSTEHQHADWARHKQECRELAKQKEINNNIRMMQLQQQVAATSITGHNRPMKTQTPSQSCKTIITTTTTSTTIPMTETTNSITTTTTTTTTNTTETSSNGCHSMEKRKQQQQYMILGTNENEIMNTQAEACNSCHIFLNENHHPNHNNIHKIHEEGHGEKSNENNIHHTNHKSNNVVADADGDGDSDVDDGYNAASGVSSVAAVMPKEIPLQRTSNTAELIPQLSSYANNQLEKSSSYQIGRMDENVSCNVNERRYEDLCRNIINDMNEYGLSVVDDFLGMEKGLQILNEVHHMYSAGVFKDGQLVNNSRPDQDLRTIRGDKITWVKGVEPTCSNVGYLINQIDNVICRANTMNDNGKIGQYKIKERTKAMVACYPGSGSQYVMHVDNPNRDGRVITAIYYLNVDWDTLSSGGLLRIFPEHGNTVADIEPIFDRLIFFWSDKRNPHEVQPAHRTRYAITVWYFDANEREAALNRCKSTTTTTLTTNTTTSSRSSQILLSPNDNQNQTSNPTTEPESTNYT